MVRYAFSGCVFRCEGVLVYTGDYARFTTVTVTDSQRNERGLINKTSAPIYRGAVVVCDGADNPQVNLDIVSAVSNITGLRSDQISVLKMK